MSNGNWSKNTSGIKFILSDFEVVVLVVLSTDDPDEIDVKIEGLFDMEAWLMLSSVDWDETTSELDFEVVLLVVLSTDDPDELDP